MKRIMIVLLAVNALCCVNARAGVNSHSNDRLDMISIGLGFGFDHGGFGANVLAYPQKYIGLFAGGGYALAGFGYNIGAKVRIVPPRAKVNPYIMGMYGYNSAIVVSGAASLDKLFYGPTVGLGLDLRPNKDNWGYWTFAVLVPIRNSDVDDYRKDLEDNHGVVFKSGLMPIGFSMGCRIIINRFAR